MPNATPALLVGLVGWLSACDTVSLLQDPDSETLAEQLDSSIAGPGRVRMFIGQDLASIRDYDQAVGPPAGVVGYTALDGLAGIDTPTDTGAGVNHLDALVADFPGAPVAVGLYLVGRLGSVNAGELDLRIHELGDLLGRYDVPVLLRIGYEFDGAWTAYEPEAYRLAFRRIADGVRDRGADNVEFVWQSMAGCEPTFGNHPRIDWYPGDEYVDWISVSLFVEPERCAFRPQLEMVAIARERTKPFFIAEATPMGFDLDELTVGRTSPDRVPVPSDAIVERWFEPYFEFITDHLDVIRASTYINADWDSQPMWGPPHANGYWGDSRVQANEDIRSYWIDRMSSPPFVIDEN